MSNFKYEELFRESDRVIDDFRRFKDSFRLRLYHCPFQELERVADIQASSVDLVLADPPYGKAWLDQIPDLAQFSRRVLKDGGLLALVYGQHWLNFAFQRLSDSLTYCWTAAIIWRGLGTVSHQRQVLSKWRPVLVFGKGRWRTRSFWHDPIASRGKEKERHHWQLPMTDTAKLVQNFSNLGDLVVDPCGGAFTTAVACEGLSRHCISCDVDPDAVRLGRERLAESRNARNSR